MLGGGVWFSTVKVTLTLAERFVVSVAVSCTVHVPT
jgi:hypothetical protein